MSLTTRNTSAPKPIGTKTASGSESIARRKGARRLVPVIAPIIALLIVFGVWQAASTFGGLEASVLPSPIRVVTAGWGDRAAIGQATAATLQITLLGLIAAIGAAILVATVLSFVAPLRMALLPVLIGAQSVPVIVLAPLFIIWFGFDAGPKIAIVAIVSMLPMTIATLQGLQSADPDSAVLLRSMGASRWQVFLRLRVPTALPHFITGLRIMTSFIVVSAIFSEYVGARVGLGIYMQTEKNLYRTDLVFAAVFVSIAIGLALFLATYLLENLAMPWERRRKKALR